MPRRRGRANETIHAGPTLLWWQRGQTPRGLRDFCFQSAWIIGAVCPPRDAGVALVMTRIETAAMNLFLVELSQAVAPGAHGILLMDKAGWRSPRKREASTQSRPSRLDRRP